MLEYYYKSTFNIYLEEIMKYEEVRLLKFFTYNEESMNSQYYEILEMLMERWEYEIVEFKEAKNQYNTDKIGQYFSAISNEANLKQQQYGWLIFGISESKERHVVGTAYKKGDGILEKFKYEISKSLTAAMTFLDIIELFPIVDGKNKRVLLFKIPAAATGIPTGWKNNYYARAGESLVPLQQFKIDMIRAQERRDWSKRIIENSSIQYLDRDAIKLAKEKYKEKMAQEHIIDEVNNMSDEEFLTKLKLLINGHVTNAAMVLLGNSEYDYVLQTPPVMMWRLYGVDGSDRDYKIYKIPFINVVDKIFQKIRNLTYRYMPNQMTLFPVETQQYDTWLLRELLNNCIAHSNYQIGGRIYINEFEDKIKISNPGDFLPQKIESVLEVSYNPPFYRNQLLAESMVNFHMIDTATMGIRRVFKIQKDKFFPMPDYDFSSGTQVDVIIYGKILNENYMHILYDHQDLDLQTVFLLDQVQKGKKISKEAVQYLRKMKLIEGRINNLYISSRIAKSVEDEAQYIKNKAFDDQYYKDLIVNYLKEFKKAKKRDIRGLLWDKLPDVLSDKQKTNKISNLLAALKRQGVIDTDSSNQQKSNWILKDSK